MVNYKRRVFFLDLLLICVILLTSCQPSQTTSSPTQTPTQSPTSIPLPEPDKATVIGQIVSQEDRSPIRDTVVHLAAVYRQGEEGAYVIDSANSPGAFTDQEGRFVIANIAPGEFVLVIGDPMTNYSVVSDEEGKVKTWAAASNQILDMDQIRTDFIP